MLEPRAPSFALLTLLTMLTTLSLAACAKQGTGPTQTACTMEAMMCPDGSSVGRTGPNCEFEPCPAPPEGEPVACTKEAKICPDGSAVGRTGPNCEFEPCPGEAAPPSE